MTTDRFYTILHVARRGKIEDTLNNIPADDRVVAIIAAHGVGAGSSIDCEIVCERRRKTLG